MLFRIPVLLCSLLCTLAASPLGENDLLRLDATVDGQDRKGEGFAVLVENVRLWQLPIADHNTADLALISFSPSSFRGELMTVSGVVEQQVQLNSPWDDVGEWFVRDSQGIPYALYVVGEYTYSVGSTITVPARFYKTMSINARDGKSRIYPAFVTTTHAIVYSIPSSTSFSPLLLLPVLVAASFFVFILGRVGKKNRTAHQSLHIKTDEVLQAVSESTGDLPEDPAGALSSMYEQSEDVV